jgi:hypothetical protein
MKRPPGKPTKTLVLKDLAAMLMHAEQINAAQQLIVNRWGSWCDKKGHAPRLPAPKPQQQQQQQQQQQHQRQQ